jgi:hypothetical protein
MATYQISEIKDIVLKNPNKKIIEEGKKAADKLRLHVHGVGMKNAIERCEHFEDADVFNIRQKYAVSNKDLFARLLQKEEMVFTARGGSMNFNLPEEKEKTMYSLLNNIRYNMALRKWVKTFALQAYRCDPASIILIEVEPLKVDTMGQMNNPRPYPTYKSIYAIYDYLPNGRKIEHVCFNLTIGEAKNFGVTDTDFNDKKPDEISNYYRFIDDSKDIIVKKTENNIIIATIGGAKNPIKNKWGITPGFVVSDIVKYDQPEIFQSPLQGVVELADSFLYDRSVRDLQKKYHGFAKAVEPLLTCSTCVGTGYLASNACPDCTPHGAEKGTGFKMKTKVSDVARFPLEIFQEGSGFDFKKVFGYVSPDVQGWEKQDNSLADIEMLITSTYWHTATDIKTTGPSASSGDVTATKTYFDQKPIIARLNATADWAESTENMIAYFIGKFWFESAFKQSSITYGRDYNLKTAAELLDEYMSMRSKGVPDFVLDKAMERYVRSLYENSPLQMAKALKMLDVEPFPHLSLSQSKAIIPDELDYQCKVYFGEWVNTIEDAKWINPQYTAQVLKEELKAYVQAKNITQPEPVS